MRKDKPILPGGQLATSGRPVRRQKLRKTATIIISALASVALFVVVVFTCIEATALDEGRYQRLYEQFGIVQDTGLNSMGDLMNITHELLSYCRGDRDDLNMQAVIHGGNREVFSEREKAHMVDVQNLFVKGYKTRTVAAVSLLFLLLLLVYVARRRTLRELALGWVITVSVLGALLLAVGIAFAVDFDAAWTQFHYIFFSNDLWLLYEDDMLILMLIKLFSSIVRSVILCSGVSLAVITAAAIAILRLDRKKRREHKAEQHEPTPQS